MRVAIAVACALFVGSAAHAQSSSQTGHTTPATPPAQKASAPPAHPLTDAQAHELLKITGADHLKEEMVQGMMSYASQAFPPFMPKDVSTDLEKNLQAADVQTQIIHLYQQHISTEDAAALIAFYKTPAGQHVINELPSIEQESRMEAAKVGQSIGQSVMASHRAEIQAAVQKYRQEHPPAGQQSPSPAPQSASPAPQPKK
jgi:hypothetical protein